MKLILYMQLKLTVVTHSRVPLKNGKKAKLMVLLFLSHTLYCMHSVFVLSFRHLDIICLFVFASSTDEKMVCLDPHYCQSSVDMSREDFPTEVDTVFPFASTNSFRT